MCPRMNSCSEFILWVRFVHGNSNIVTRIRVIPHLQRTFISALYVCRPGTGRWSWVELPNGSISYRICCNDNTGEKIVGSEPYNYLFIYLFIIIPSISINYPSDHHSHRRKQKRHKKVRKIVTQRNYSQLIHNYRPLLHLHSSSSPDMTNLHRTFLRSIPSSPSNK